MPDRDRIARESRLVIERGSKSFALASLLFDEHTRESAHLLYAWCRYCDDVIDGQELGFTAETTSDIGERERLFELETKTRSAIAGSPTDEPIFIALSRVLARHEIPPRHPLELLEGFAMDVEGVTYSTLEDTLRYCYHVAGVVGVMMAYVMGVRDRETLNRASDLGIALQLTNIARDVVEDAEMGRVYLPGDWLSEAGLEREPRRARGSLFAVRRRRPPPNRGRPLLPFGRGRRDAPATSLRVGHRDRGRRVSRHRADRPRTRTASVGRARDRESKPQDPAHARGRGTGSRESRTGYREPSRGALDQAEPRDLRRSSGGAYRNPYETAPSRVVVRWCMRWA